MRVTAKICGLSTEETIHAAVRGGAAYVGFVFHQRSPRAVTIDQAQGLADATGLNPLTRQETGIRTQIVGVFVDEPHDYIDTAVSLSRLDAIQLHGSQSPEEVDHLRRLTGLEIWKAVPVKTRADLDQARPYRSAAARVVYDARTPPGAPLPGGMGLRFDWKLLDGFTHPLPWALSGGLDPANVGEAAVTTGASLVDVSSGVESAPGVKDVDKIAAFLNAVRHL
jgi:phosphoribosylanthranilate isomerase